MLLNLLLFLLLFTGCTTLHPPSNKEAVSVHFEPQKPIRIALVLGGGGSKGIAHLGAIQELEKAGIRPDLIVACSAGAIVGAFYADEPNLTGVEKLFLNLKKSDLMDTTLLGSRFGFVKGKKIQNFIQKNLNAETFESLKIPLIVMATDLFTGDPVELHQGNLPVAINASCAFPGIFKPVFLNNQYLIDGGASTPVPIEIAKKYGADLIIAIDVSEKLPTSKPSHLFGIAKRGMEIAYQKLISQSLEKADIAIRMNFQDIGMFSEHLNRQMHEEGQAQVRLKLSEIHEKIKQLKHGAYRS